MKPRPKTIRGPSRSWEADCNGAGNRLGIWVNNTKPLNLRKKAINPWLYYAYDGTALNYLKTPTPIDVSLLANDVETAYNNIPSLYAYRGFSGKIKARRLVPQPSSVEGIRLIL